MFGLEKIVARMKNLRKLPEPSLIWYDGLGYYAPLGVIPHAYIHLKNIRIEEVWRTQRCELVTLDRRCYIEPKNGKNLVDHARKHRANVLVLTPEKKMPIIDLYEYVNGMVEEKKVEKNTSIIPYGPTIHLCIFAIVHDEKLMKYLQEN